MKFEEIFKEDGLYKADFFRKGCCFEVKEGVLYLKDYENKSDISPNVQTAMMYKDLLKKDYSKVLNVNQLF